jgi:hypothetical protein
LTQVPNHKFGALGCGYSVNSEQLLVGRIQ